MDTIPLSIVMPAYNEQDCIENTITEVINKIVKHIPLSEIVVIEDGSKDMTGTILDQLEKKYPPLRVIHQVNSGHGAALIRGLNEAKGAYILLIDSDGEVSLDTFMKIWDKKGTLDAILGYRQIRTDAPLRRFLTKGLRFFLYSFLGAKVKDANAPFKLFSATIWEEAKKNITSRTNAPSIILALFIAKKFTYKEVAIEHIGRKTGRVSIQRWKLIKYCFRTLRDIFKFKMIKASTRSL